MGDDGEDDSGDDGSSDFSGDDGSTVIDDGSDGSSDLGDTSGTDGLGSDSSGLDDTTYQDGSVDLQTAIDSGAVDTGDVDTDGNAVVQNSDGTYTTYDGDGNPVANYSPAGTLLESFTTDDAGNTTTSTDFGSTDGSQGTDAAGNAILSTYSDGLGNTVEVSADASGNLIYTTLDPNGNVMSITDANGNSLNGGSSVAAGSVGTGAAMPSGGKGSGGSGGGGPSGGSSGGSSGGGSSSNASQLQALENQLQALANALAAAKNSSTVPLSTIDQLQTRAGEVNGQIADLGGTPSPLFPTTGTSIFSGTTGTILIVGGVALAAILLSRRPAPVPQAA